MSSIEAGIHQHWTNWKPLEDLVPAARLITGFAADEPDFPYVQIERQGDSESVRTSSGTILEAAQIRFSIWSPDLDAAKAIHDLIRTRFNRAAFEWPGGEVLDCKPTNQMEIKEGDGTWHVMADYTVRARFN